MPGQDKFNKTRLREAISRLNPEIVFIWGMWQLNPELAALAEELCPNRVVHYFCGFWPIPAEEANPHISYWKRHQLPLGWLALPLLKRRRKRQLQIKHVACVSQFVRGVYEKHGFQFVDALVIYGGIDTQAFARPSENTKQEDQEPLKLLFAGAVSPQKGADTAVAAMARLAEKYPPAAIQLSVVGSGHPNFVKSLHQTAAEEGLDAYVTFRERIPKEQMASLFHQHDLLLFTSTWQEPLARMMMEALAASTVVISTPTGGSPEAIEHGQNGLLFATGDDADLAHKIEQLMADPQLRRRLAERGRQTAVTRFDFQRMADELEQFCLHRAAQANS
jgi:glycosyltransferase involved in cell wall biosynthesis